MTSIWLDGCGEGTEGPRGMALCHAMMTAKRQLAWPAMTTSATKATLFSWECSHVEIARPGCADELDQQADALLLSPRHRGVDSGKEQ